MGPLSTPDQKSNPNVDDTLARGRELAEAGQYLEAVASLTAANRLYRDPRLEQRLAKLRHTAFSSLDTDGGRTDWPPEYPDRFPDVVDGPPEIDVSELDAAAVGSGILHHGALLVRGLVGEPRLSELIEDIDKAFEALDGRVEAEPWPTDKSPWFYPFTPDEPYNVGKARQWVVDGGGVWTVDAPRAMFDLLEAIEETGLAEVLTEHLGERPALSVKKSTLRRVPVNSGTEWHQDGAFLGEGIRTVNVWLALSECGEHAPSLDVVPCRLDDLVETGTHGAQFDWSVGPRLVDQLAERCEVVRPHFAAGDAILFDERFLHRTGLSPSMTKPRYAIESWFFAPSTYPYGQVPVAF